MNRFPYSSSPRLLPLALPGALLLAIACGDGANDPTDAGSMGADGSLDAAALDAGMGAQDVGVDSGEGDRSPPDGGAQDGGGPSDGAIDASAGDGGVPPADAGQRAPRAWRNLGADPRLSGHVSQLGPTAAPIVVAADPALFRTAKGNALVAADGTILVTDVTEQGEMIVSLDHTTFRERGRFPAQLSREIALRPDDAIVGGGVIPATMAGQPDQHVVAAYERSGSQLFSHELTTDVRQDPAASGGATADADGNVYVCLATGELVSLSTAGAERWRAAACRGTPAIWRDLVVAQTSSGVNAIRRSNGQRVWNETISADGVASTGPAGIAIGPDGVVYVATNSNVAPNTGLLVAFDAEDGTELFTFRAQEDERFRSGPAVSENLLVIASGDRRSSPRGYLRALAPRTGALLWVSEDLGPVPTRPIIDGEGRVYLTVNERGILGFAPDGRLLFEGAIGSGTAFSELTMTLSGDLIVDVDDLGWVLLKR